HPLKRFVSGLGIAVSLAAALEGKDVVAVVAQELGIGHTRPAIRAEFQTEQDDAGALAGRRRQVTAPQGQTIAGRETNILRVRHRQAARHDKQRLFTKHAHEKIEVAKKEMEIEQYEQ